MSKSDVWLSVAPLSLRMMAKPLIRTDKDYGAGFTPNLSPSVTEWAPFMIETWTKEHQRTPSRHSGVSHLTHNIIWGNDRLLRVSDERARLLRIELKVSEVTTFSSIRIYNDISLKIKAVLIDHTEALVVRMFFHPYSVNNNNNNNNLNN